ncbi:hypothetical protein GCM10027612_70340 [Microbispora bryophytorum subsp. camponoti]
MARNLLAALLLFVALVLQVSVVNRLLFSWAPDLVLLTVAALATRRGPVPGAVIGFCGGLAYDLLPPPTTRWASTRWCCAPSATWRGVWESECRCSRWRRARWSRPACWRAWAS